MHQTSPTFGIKLNNIPLINLRSEFMSYYKLLSDPRFVEQFQKRPQPIRTPYFIWLDCPENLLTHFLQKAILGVESYLPGAVYYELGIIGSLKENIEYVRNPFAIRGARGTANLYYNALPSLVDKAFSLKRCDEDLWAHIDAFYKEIRNPIFHGMQLEIVQINETLELFKLIAKIYVWIDSWHSPEKVLPGFSKMCNSIKDL